MKPDIGVLVAKYQEAHLERTKNADDAAAKTRLLTKTITNIGEWLTTLERDLEDAIETGALPPAPVVSHTYDGCKYAVFEYKNVHFRFDAGTGDSIKVTRANNLTSFIPRSDITEDLIRGIVLKDLHDFLDV